VGINCDHIVHRYLVEDEETTYIDSSGGFAEQILLDIRMHLHELHIATHTHSTHHTAHTHYTTHNVHNTHLHTTLICTHTHVHTTLHM